MTWDELCTAIDALPDESEGDGLTPRQRAGEYLATLADEMLSGDMTAGEVRRLFAYQVDGVVGVSTAFHEYRGMQIRNILNDYVQDIGELRLYTLAQFW